MQTENENLLPESFRPNGNHPVAEIFPMMDKESLANLAIDINVNGLREPVWVYEDKIIDGRNRSMACIDAAVKCRYRAYTGEPANLVAFVLSLNLHRRHLSEGQRAMVAAKVANLGEGNPAFQKGATTSIDVVGISQPEAAKMLNVGTASVQRAKQVIKRGTPELVAAVERGEVSVRAANILASVEPEQQIEAVAAGPEVARETATKIEAGRTKALLEGKPTKQKADKLASLGLMIDELVEMTTRPVHRYPYIQLRNKAAELQEMFSKAFAAHV